MSELFPPETSSNTNSNNKSSGGGYESRTKNGYELMPVASSMQKMIRRGCELEAIYWAHELLESGFAPYCLYRLSVIACEDIGFADPASLAAVNSTLHLWMDIYEKRKKTSCEVRLAVTTVILIMCRARKSRIADDAINLVQERRKAGWKMDYPDIALDQHNRQGRNLGRNNAFWVDVGSVVVPEASTEEMGGPIYKDLTNPMWIEQAKDKAKRYRLSDPDDALSPIITEPRYEEIID